MIDPSSVFSATVCEAILSYAGGMAIKSTLLLLLAFGLDRLFARRVLARSSLWHATLVALALLPLAIFLPPLNVGWDKQAERVPAHQVDPAHRDWQHRQRQPASATESRSYRGRPALASSLAPPYERSRITFRQRLAWCILGVYCAGCIALAIRLVGSLRAVGALVAKAEPLADERWSKALNHWQRQLGISIPVRLRTSSDAAVPVQIGWLRPAILLPTRVAAANDESTRTAVLVHELGHVQRSDYGWNLLLHVLSIIYWPHPLVWLAGRRIAQLREQACDELCIHWLSGAATYRAKLIELAEGLLLRPSIAALGIAMSQQTKLARRLEWIGASAGRAHCLASPLTRRSSLAAMVLVASLLGAATAARSAAQAQAAGDAVAKDGNPSESPPGPKEAPPSKSDNKAPKTRSIVEQSIGPFSNTAPKTGLVIISLTDAGEGKAAVYLIDRKTTRPLLGTPEEQDAQIKGAVEKGLAAGKAMVLIKAEEGVSHRDVSRVVGVAGAVEGVKVKLAVMEPEKEQSESAESGPVRVRVERVKRHDLTIETSQPCSLSAGRTSVVYARVPGFVKRMAVEIGDDVKKGQILAELESLELGPEMEQAESLLAEAKAEQQQSAAVEAEAEAKLAAAQAEAQKADAELEGAAVKLQHREKRYQRVKNLVAEKAVDEKLADEAEEQFSAAKSAHDLAKLSVEPAKALVRQRQAAVASARAGSKLADARLRVAEAKLAEAKLRSDAVQIVSPIEGVIVERNAHVGEFLGTAEKRFPVCTVADLRRLSAVVWIPELDGLKVKRGAAARIRLDALPGQVFTATVSRVGLNIDVNTRTLRVDLELDADNSDTRLLPGMLGSAAVAVGERRGVLSIPREAQRAPSSVLTVVEGRATFKSIEDGAMS
ncbi:MAG TPA: efflux RND transporter periplasmic adaptor subunit, partial [Pirellulales bacterium]|nr:efflux RND transporter periplasmic adaptor subunit [Pirellulales bacterium]